MCPPEEQFPMAVVFVGGFFVTLAISPVDFAFGGTLFGGWMGAIIGFYFGRKLVDQPKRNLDKERSSSGKLVDQTRSQSDRLWQGVEWSR